MTLAECLKPITKTTPKAREPPSVPAIALQAQYKDSTKQRELAPVGGWCQVLLRELVCVRDTHLTGCAISAARLAVGGLSGSENKPLRLLGMASASTAEGQGL